jgi:membrane fusion protein (multidrug efflux system)
MIETEEHSAVADSALGTARDDGKASPPAPKAAPLVPAPASQRRGPLRWIIGGAVALLAIALAAHWIIDALRTVSTDDAYVNGHVTYVAARVPGQVARVLVDDNNRVRKGDLLVQLDDEPYHVQLHIAQAAVTAAESDLTTAQAQARSLVGQMRSARFALERAIEDVNNQIALLRSRVATLNSKDATLAKAQADYDRAVPLRGTGAISKEDLDTRQEALSIAQAQVEEALQGIYQVRVALGLPAKPPSGEDLAQVRPDLDQTFSAVREAESKLIQAAAQLGVSDSFDKTPQQLIADFYKRDPEGNIDRIYAHILENAPGIVQARSKLDQAHRALDQAELNLRYCNVLAEIDGVVTRRSVNPGNNVTVGQSLMAVRSLTDIWVDANFKETQLARLRIGQPADLNVDMYGSRERFRGRISGFTMGTGSTLALLPAENATGNFVKVVQRLPVRIDLIDYDPDRAPLFVGLSVTPSVHITDPATGPSAGSVLQPYDAAAAASAKIAPVPTTTPSTQEPRS